MKLSMSDMNEKPKKVEKKEVFVETPKVDDQVTIISEEVEEVKP